MVTARRHRRIRRRAADVWALVGDAGRLAEWFPGIVAARVDGDRRTIELATGVTLEETIVERDDLVRRFRYRITPNGLIESHQGIIDVLDDGDTSIVVYTQEVEPPAMAVILGGACEAALDEAARLLESDGEV